MNERPLRVLSLGAGVQSSALLLMAIKGDVPPIDAAVFADTQAEPQPVYGWLDYLEARAKEAGIPLYRVSRGNLRDDALENKTESWMPLFSREPGTGKVQQLKRQCTRNYKIRPIRRQVRALGGGPKRPVEQIVGISTDEFQRMRTSDVQYITNRYPLVEQRITRADAAAYLVRDGSPEPVKSACTFCPFRTNREFRALPTQDFADAVVFDQGIRSVRSRTTQQEVFVHRSATPLGTVDLRSQEDKGQMGLFDGCGVVCASGATA